LPLKEFEVKRFMAILKILRDRCKRNNRLFNEEAIVFYLEMYGYKSRVYKLEKEKCFEIWICKSPNNHFSYLGKIYSKY